MNTKLPFLSTTSFLLLPFLNMLESLIHLAENATSSCNKFYVLKELICQDKYNSCQAKEKVSCKIN